MVVCLKDRNKYLGKRVFFIRNGTQGVYWCARGRQPNVTDVVSH